MSKFKKCLIQKIHFNNIRIVYILMQYLKKIVFGILILIFISDS